MKKSFHAFLIEQETEHTYKVMSVANIHDPELMGRIGMAMSLYNLLEIEKDYFEPVREHNKEFPNHPNTPCYCVRVVLGTHLPDIVVTQAVAQFTNIAQENIKVTGGKKEPEEKAADTTEVKDAQADVGERRLGDFIKELEKARKEPEEVELPKIEESFAVHHGAVQSLIGRPVRRGYYIVESKDGEKALVTGPYKKAPTNYVFEECLNPGLKLVNESRRNDLYLFEFDASGLTPADQEVSRPRKWEVEVLDNDTGKSYPVVVSATDDVNARNKAIGNVAMRNQLNPESLIATNPTSRG